MSDSSTRTAATQVYKSAIHECLVLGTNPMHVAAKKRWKFCPFCGENLTRPADAADLAERDAKFPDLSYAVMKGT